MCLREILLQLLTKVSEEVTFSIFRIFLLPYTWRRTFLSKHQQITTRLYGPTFSNAPLLICQLPRPRVLQCSSCVSLFWAHGSHTNISVCSLFFTSPGQAVGRPYGRNLSEIILLVFLWLCFTTVSVQCVENRSFFRNNALCSEIFSSIYIPPPPPSLQLVSTLLFIQNKITSYFLDYSSRHLFQNWCFYTTLHYECRFQ